MPGRKRNVHLHVMVTEDELAAIHARMAEAGISNTGAYVRKMALNGYILHVDLAPVKELVSLQRRCSNNLNQVAVQAVGAGVGGPAGAFRTGGKVRRGRQVPKLEPAALFFYGSK